MSQTRRSTFVKPASFRQVIEKKSNFCTAMLAKCVDDYLLYKTRRILYVFFANLGAMSKHEHMFQILVILLSAICYLVLARFHLHYPTPQYSVRGLPGSEPLANLPSPTRFAIPLRTTPYRRDTKTSVQYHPVFR